MKARSLVFDLFGDYLRYRGGEVRLRVARRADGLLRRAGDHGAGGRDPAAQGGLAGEQARRPGDGLRADATAWRAARRGALPDLRSRRRAVGRPLAHGHLLGARDRSRAARAAAQEAGLAGVRAARAVGLVEPARPHSTPSGRRSSSEPVRAPRRLPLALDGRRVGPGHRRPGVGSGRRSTATTPSCSREYRPRLAGYRAGELRGRTRWWSGCGWSTTIGSSRSATRTCRRELLSERLVGAQRPRGVPGGPRTAAGAGRGVRRRRSCRRDVRLRTPGEQLRNRYVL